MKTLLGLRVILTLFVAVLMPLELSHCAFMPLQAAAAAAVADVLIAAVNSDVSVGAIKGQGRPVMKERERAEIVSAIRGVGLVTIFEETSPARILSILQPDFHCKGTDYTPESVPEAAVVNAYGGRVVIVGDPKDHSTTALLAKIGRRADGCN